MRKILGVVLLSLVVGAPAMASDSFSTGIGVNFFRYETPYLSAITATYLVELQEGLELNLGSEFNITTSENAEGDVVPSFVIPANVGLNFTFPRERVTYLFGTGLTPVFNVNPDTEESFRFFMGPYVKGEMRIRVHPIMSWFVAYQQDLLIGGETWISAASRITTGINFAFPGPESR